MFDTVLDVVFPRRCVGCQGGPWPFCESCVRRLVPLSAPWCTRCGRPTERPIERCSDCPPDPVASARSPFLFAGPARAAILRLKFGGWRTVAEAFAAAMAAIRPPPAGVITWVPLSPRREAERGYDQARALAQALSPRVDVPAVRLLRRVRTTSPQALRPGRERRVLLSDSFRPIRDAPSSVLLVDDVLTTGATSAACARALLSAGAVSVVLVTATRALPGPLPLRYARDGFPFGSVVARGGSPEVDASRGRNDPRKATVGR